MSDLMIAYCGLDCSQCHAYLAKQKNDDELRKEAVEKWSTPDYPVSVDDINCDGCKPEGGVHFKWCNECELRSCGSTREVETCAHCEDYECDKVQKMIEMAGDTVRERLEKIRKNL